MTTPDTSGPALPPPFAYYDPEESCWRTSQGTFLLGSDLFSGTWPRSGTTRAGFAYELPMPALPTGEPASSSSLPTPRASRGASGTETMYALGAARSDEGRPQGEVLLPTPTVNDMGAAYTPETWDAWTARMQDKHGNGNGHGKSLEIEAQRLLPTPKSTNNENRQSLDRYGPNLGMVIQDLLPTPGCAGGGKKIPEDAVWSGKAAYKATGEKVQVHIDQIAVLLATPNARDYKGSPSDAWGEQASLPRDVERLSRGETTSPRSDDGNASQGDQPPDPPTLW